MQMMLTQDTQSFFEHLGGLHGSEVLSIFFNEQKKECMIKVDDFYANFVGLPDIPFPSLSALANASTSISYFISFSCINYFI